MHELSEDVLFTKPAEWAVSGTASSRANAVSAIHS